MVAEPPLIGVAWGTSSLRVALIGVDRLALAAHAAAAGILTVDDGDVAAVLHTAIAALDAPPGLPLVLSGMITSRQGWHELARLPCPAGADGLPRAIYRVGALGRRTGSPHRVAAPGRRTGSPHRVAAPGEVVVLLGTHSRWVVVENGRIMLFHTYLTGELFAVLARRYATLLDRDGIRHRHGRPDAAADGQWRIAGVAEKKLGAATIDLPLLAIGEALGAAGASGFGVGSAHFEPGMEANEAGRRAAVFVAAWRAPEPWASNTGTHTLRLSAATGPSNTTRSASRAA